MKLNSVACTQRHADAVKKPTGAVGILLSDLRSPSYVDRSETVQLTNNVPSDRSEVILPITATLVEVPESHSYPSVISFP